MSDYISREAAIKIIEEKQRELCPLGMFSRHAVYGSDREKFDAWEEIIEQMEQIPAADVCPYYIGNKHDRGDDSLCGKFNVAVNSTANMREVKWISVKERLPVGGDKSGAICENVNLLFDDGLVTCGWMNGITGKVYYLNARDDVIIKAPISRVTHWMPLPEPPKEEQA